MFKYLLPLKWEQECGWLADDGKKSSRGSKEGTKEAARGAFGATQRNAQFRSSNLSVERTVQHFVGASQKSGSGWGQATYCMDLHTFFLLPPEERRRTSAAASAAAEIMWLASGPAADHWFAWPTKSGWRVNTKVKNQSICGHALLFFHRPSLFCTLAD